jgi:hypothetical protein
MRSSLGLVALLVRVDVPTTQREQSFDSEGPVLGFQACTAIKVSYGLDQV